jgi:hypothetical protein
MAEQVRGLNQMLDRYRVKDMIESAKGYAAPAAATPSPRAERRNGNRPWAAPARKRANGAVAAAVVPDVTNDNEWREF